MLSWILRAVTRPFRWLLIALDWLLSNLSTMNRPQSMDDTNARYGIDSRDAMGERLGQSGARPGERPQPRD